jgi:hypothetical protein
MANASSRPPFAKFDFDLAGAVIGQLVEAFGKLGVGALAPAVLNDVDAGNGIYQLHYDEQLVYIGSAKRVRARLLQHHEKLSGRKNIDLSNAGFKCLFVDRAWVQVTHERQLLEHHADCRWNQSGFGNHDYGRDRDTTRPNWFDLTYPINELWECRTVTEGAWEARKLLLAIKDELPYTFRFETDSPKRWRDGSTSYNGRTISVSRPGMPAKELLQEIVTQFPPGWQATLFPGHMILYEENRRYPHSFAELR